jgi:hypothetical protein
MKINPFLKPDLDTLDPLCPAVREGNVENIEAYAIFLENELLLRLRQIQDLERKIDLSSSWG